MFGWFASRRANSSQLKLFERKALSNFSSLKNGSSLPSRDFPEKIKALSDVDPDTGSIVSRVIVDENDGHIVNVSRKSNYCIPSIVFKASQP